MLTVAELAAAMEGSGRRLTPRTARNWWSVGILPRPARTGLGRGVGTVSFWRDRRVLLQAQIAHDLLSREVSLQGRRGGPLVGWLSCAHQRCPRGVRPSNCGGTFGAAAAGHETGSKRLSGSLSADLSDARTRSGSREDDEGVAVYTLTGELFELLYGVGDGAPESVDPRQWAVDTATELLSQIEFLAPINGVNLVPSVQTETVEEVVTWISETASLRRQRDAVVNAQPHDWIRARRITRMAIGLLNRANAATSPEQHVANRALFTRLAVGWARLLFPVLLAAVRNPQQHQSVARTIFAAAAIIRRGPVRTQNSRRGQKR
jgi:hypothetical protein